MKKLLALAGDGIGPEVIGQAEAVFAAVRARLQLDIAWESAPIGGSALEAHGEVLPPATLERALAADACLLGAVGGPRWDALPLEQRPEQALLKLRSGLQAYSNLRPIRTFPELAAASPLKPELVSGLDILIVRELVGGIYFGEPRGVRVNSSGEREGFNTLVYSESEIERIARSAFELARQRSARLCSVDKANVLEVMRLWREVVDAVATDYPEVSVEHMYVDNCAMQLVRAPKQFDVIVCGNMFGDILSDCAAMLTGSIGMLASAALNAGSQGLYEPVHGSAPDLAGKDQANPIAAILSLALALRHSLEAPEAADLIESAVAAALQAGVRSADIYHANSNEQLVGCAQMGSAICAHLA